MIALLDLDYLVYSCGFACQKIVWDVLIYDDFGNVIECQSSDSKEQAANGATPRVVAEPVEYALHAFSESVEKILRNTKATGYKAYLTGTGNFRDAVATTRPYKGNRDPLHKPVHYQALRDYAVSKYKATIVNDMEADDAVTMYHCKCYNNNKDTIIASVDKDFNQVPGWHYNPKKDVLYWVDEDDARRHFWESVLSGDPVDNIQGIPGVGPKKAKKILEGCKDDYDYYRTVRREFISYYRNVHGEERNGIVPSARDATGDDYLTETARLLWLKRSPDDEWQPPT